MTGPTLILLSSFFIGAYGDVTAGPFDVAISAIKACPNGMIGEHLIIVTDAKYKRVSRKSMVLNANVTHLIPFGDDIDIRANLAKQTNQGWKDNFFVLDIQRACSAFKTYIPDVERELSRQMKFKSGKCPIPAGNYSFSLPLIVDVKMFPAFTYGKYRVRIILTRNYSKIFCTEVVVDVLPRKSG